MVDSSVDPVEIVTPPRYVQISVSISVFLTTLGYLYRYADANLRTFSQLYVEWGVGERTAGVVVILMQAMLVLAVVGALFRKLRFLVIPGLCALLFELLCLTLNPNAQYPLLTVPNHALRLAPYILLLLPWNKKTAISILKFTAAATFIGHGIKCLSTNPEFVDYLLTFFRIIHAPITEVSASTLLHSIGTIDVLVGLHIIVFPGRRVIWVLRYMMVWGAVTSLARIMYYGPVAWHEVAIRNAHFLIVYLLIRLIITKETPVKPQSSAT